MAALGKEKDNEAVEKGEIGKELERLREQIATLVVFFLTFVYCFP